MSIRAPDPDCGPADRREHVRSARNPTARRRREAGSGTVALLGVIAAVLALAAAAAAGGALLAARTQAQTAADLAAVAGGQRSLLGLWQDPGTAPCARAAEVVRANGADPDQCFVRGADIYVTVARPVAVGPLNVAVRARARAGPQDG